MLRSAATKLNLQPSTGVEVAGECPSRIDRRLRGLSNFLTVANNSYCENDKNKTLKSCKSYQAASSDGITYNEVGCCNRVRISNQINYNGEYEMNYDENNTWKIERLRSNILDL